MACNSWRTTSKILSNPSFSSQSSPTAHGRKSLAPSHSRPNTAKSRITSPQRARTSPMSSKKKFKLPYWWTNANLICKPSQTSTPTSRLSMTPTSILVCFWSRKDRELRVVSINSSWSLLIRRSCRFWRMSWILVSWSYVVLRAANYPAARSKELLLRERLSSHLRSWFSMRQRLRSTSRAKRSYSRHLIGRWRAAPV